MSPSSSSSSAVQTPDTNLVSFLKSLGSLNRQSPIYQGHGKDSRLAKKHALTWLSMYQHLLQKQLLYKQRLNSLLNSLKIKKNRVVRRPNFHKEFGTWEIIGMWRVHLGTFLPEVLPVRAATVHGSHSIASIKNPWAPSRVCQVASVFTTLIKSIRQHVCFLYRSAVQLQFARSPISNKMLHMANDIIFLYSCQIQNGPRTIMHSYLLHVFACAWRLSRVSLRFAR